MDFIPTITVINYFDDDVLRYLGNSKLNVRIGLF